MMESNQTTNEPLPRTLPRPTAAPFLVAFGVTMIFAGIVTSWIISLGGLGIFIWAMGMWINELRREWKRSE